MQEILLSYPITRCWLKAFYFKGQSVWIGLVISHKHLERLSMFVCFLKSEIIKNVSGVGIDARLVLNENALSQRCWLTEWIPALLQPFWIPTIPSQWSLRTAQRLHHLVKEHHRLRTAVVADLSLLHRQRPSSVLPTNFYPVCTSTATISPLSLVQLEKGFVEMWVVQTAAKNSSTVWIMVRQFQGDSISVLNVEYLFILLYLFSFGTN